MAHHTNDCVIIIIIIIKTFCIVHYCSICRLYSLVSLYLLCCFFKYRNLLLFFAIFVHLSGLVCFCSMFQAWYFIRTCTLTITCCVENKDYYYCYYFWRSAHSHSTNVLLLLLLLLFGRPNKNKMSSDRRSDPDLKIADTVLKMECSWYSACTFVLIRFARWYREQVRALENKDTEAQLRCE